MKVLGLVMTRNSESFLWDRLVDMAHYCDAIYVFDDRSVDKTRSIALSHPKVKNVISADVGLSQEQWFFTEATILNTLYGMAEFYKPNWIIRLDDDEVIQPAHAVRRVLSMTPSEVAAIVFPHESTWRDPLFPQMVPLMGTTRTMRGAAWRYAPGLKAVKPLHNPRLPEAIHSLGEVRESEEFLIYHNGWDTLEKRIQRVDLYTSLDPECAWNYNVPYDRGLLFGFRRSEIDVLIAEYKRRSKEKNHVEQCE